MKKIITLLGILLSFSSCFSTEAEETKPALEDSIKLSNYDWDYRTLRFAFEGTRGNRSLT